MRRRDFIGMIYGAALALPFSTAAQQPGKVWRIGDVLSFHPSGAKLLRKCWNRAWLTSVICRAGISCCCIDFPVRSRTR